MISSMRGSALLLALLITSVVVILGSFLAVYLHAEMQFSERLADRDAARLATQTALAWAMQWLPQHHASIPQLPAQFHVSNQQTILDAHLSDAQARFNLNRLTQPEGVNALRHLLLGTTQRTDACEPFLQAARQMIQQQARVDAYTDATSVSLLAQKTFPDLAVKKLFITLPLNTPVNMNSVSWPVLLSLSPQITPAMAQALVQIRQDVKGFRHLAQVQAYWQRWGLSSAQAMTLSSDYFLLQVQVKRAQHHLHRQLLLAYNGRAKAKVRVLWVREE